MQEFEKDHLKPLQSKRVSISHRIFFSVNDLVAYDRGLKCRC